jgi:DNA primase
MIMGFRVANFVTSKIPTVTIMFPHRNILKYTWTSPDGITHNQIYHILMDRGRLLSVLDVWTFRAADCDTDSYMVVAKVRERLAVIKQGPHEFHMERFNLKKWNVVEGKEKCHTEVSNRFAALEDLDAEVEINSAWETTWENIKISAKGSLGYYYWRAWPMVWQLMLKTVRSKETRYTAVVTGSMWNKWW